MQNNQSSGSQNVTYSTPPVSVGNQLTDGDEFILIKSSRQGDVRVWTSAQDSTQAQHLYRQASEQFGKLETT
jgi:hypothetical protein